ncbi:MAG: DTW domain-containing protein, partial [Moraxellaceae bacterium]
MLKHSYHSLRQNRLARATKPFNARGARLIRCERCLLAQDHCICSFSSPMHSCVDWIVLMHEDEVLKPTNTGRLVADVFPNTLVFEWARLTPPEGLTRILADPQRLIVLVFPSDDAYGPDHAQRQAQLGNQRLTLILLDGTWKQARKMFNRTPWLAGIPTVAVPIQSTQYALRKAAHEGCLSTAEAAIGLLAMLDPAAAGAL